jgi:hypothetical protein
MGRWSYTDLAKWRECPRRWWLLRASYRAEDGSLRAGYPERYGVAILRGRLVHAALEAYRRWRKAGAEGEPFRARPFMKAWLDGWEEKESLCNPRVDTGALRAQLSLDLAMADFRVLAAQVKAVPPAPGAVKSRFSPVSPARPPVDAPEFWIEVDDPPLKGKLDRVRKGTLIEFKTGRPEEAHREQLSFYALLWWLKFNEVPSGLELLYTEAGEKLTLDVPTRQELEARAETYRTEICGVNALLASPPVPAKPAVDTCRYCPVRQLCDQYWSAEETKELRAFAPEQEGDSCFLDLHLVKLPGRAGSGAVVGLAHAAAVGEVRVLIDPGKCPAAPGPEPSGAFVLGARVTRLKGSLEARVPVTGEVFWLFADGCF